MKPGLIVLLAAALCRAADPSPRPPCAGEAVPPYPAAGAPPAVRVWDAARGRDWTPPECLGWAPPGYSSLVTTTARFRNPGGLDALRQRLATVSKLAGLHYWSTSRQGWEPLVTAASALTASEGGRRPDFAPDEIAGGRTLALEQEDSVFGKGIYRLRIRAAAANRLEFEIVNAGVIRLLLLPVFQPGELEAAYYLDRESGEVWRYYAMARTRGAGGALVSAHEASAINRAVALYRYLVGIPPDQEPPAAR